MSHPSLNIEQELFIEAIRKKYGYDFRHYNQSSISRRIEIVKDNFSINSVAEMVSEVLLNPEVAYEFIRQMSIVHTNMFRDPKVFVEFKQSIIADLKTYPFLKVWHAGCATGEEVYSMAIFLIENDLYDRTHFYATDYNQIALDAAILGEYDYKRWDSFLENYQLMGGNTKLENYFDIDEKKIRIKEHIKQNITFASHNLVSDSVFGEMNLIMCRNVMIYFDHVLKNRVLNLFYDSLDHRGILCIGKAEDMDEDYLKEKFITLSSESRIFRKNMLGVAA